MRYYDEHPKYIVKHIRLTGNDVFEEKVTEKNTSVKQIKSLLGITKTIKNIQQFISDVPRIKIEQRHYNY
jgi:hypothetical protein